MAESKRAAELRHFCDLKQPVVIALNAPSRRAFRCLLVTAPSAPYGKALEALPSATPVIDIGVVVKYSTGDD